MKRFTSKLQKIGEYGEEICVHWLKNNQFTILDRNYTTKEGEIDIIAKKNNILHFIEVKSVSCESTDVISRETIYNPSENLTREKIGKCYKAIASYRKQLNVTHETSQFDLYIIYIDRKNIKHKIERIEHIV